MGLSQYQHFYSGDSKRLLKSFLFSLMAHMVKKLPAMLKTWVWSLDWEDPLKKGKATHSSSLAWTDPLRRVGKKSMGGLGSSRDQNASIHWIIEKAREFQKNIYFCWLTTPKPMTMWITTNCGKFLKRWEYQTTLPASWEICMQVKKQQLELDMEQWTGSKWGKEHVKAIYCHPAYLTYIQCAKC